MDDYPAFVNAIAALPAEGGVVLMDSGTYYLDSPLVIARNNVVLRGQGIVGTKIVFRYPGFFQGNRVIRFQGVSQGQTVRVRQQISVHASPEGLLSLSILDVTNPASPVSIGTTTTSETDTQDGEFSVTFNTSTRSWISGTRTLRAVAKWKDANGNEQEKSEDVTFNYDSSAINSPRGVANYESAIAFVGDNWWRRGSYRYDFAVPVRRGDRQIVLKQRSGGAALSTLAAGDRITLRSKHTAAFNAVLGTTTQMPSLFRLWWNRCWLRDPMLR